MTLIYVAIGGALGSVLRYLTMVLAGRWWGTAFPYGTLAVNLLGSLAMGLLIGLIARHLPDSKTLHPLVAVGFLGGYTTFSTFSLDIVSGIERGEMVPMLIYILLSVLLGVVALFSGLWLVRTWGVA